MAEVREFIVPFTDRMAIEKFERIHGTSGEIIRCKDCKWFEREQPGMVYCPNIVGSWVEDDFFCKWGERRDDG